MPATLVDLRPNRCLLDHNFEGYKLNLQALPQYKFDLVSHVDRLYPDEVQYSYVHAKLFALHNHLIGDKWTNGLSYYYIDKQQQVRNISFDSFNNSFVASVTYDVPAHEERKSGHFNLCLSFPSSNLAVVSDGTGYLHIIETGNRNSSAGEKHNWQTLHSSLALGENKYFIIVDSRRQEKDGHEIIHCLLQSVEQTETQFNSVLSWITFENNGVMWKQSSMRQFQGKGIVHYAAIETNCEALYVGSDNIFKLTLDTAKEILDKPKEINQIIYTWLQTSDDITITLKLETNFIKELLIVSVSSFLIKVSYAGKNFLNGKLRQRVDSELTTWNIQDDGQVDILITKSESMIWDELLEGGDKNGEQVMDVGLVEEVHKRLAHLCSETEVTASQNVPSFTTQELEECDAASEEDTILARMDITKHKVTHRVPLSVHQYLFQIKLEPEEVPAVALRHDVDACVWQPFAQNINSETWPLIHQGTLMAFGYVQSSKQNRKFVTCSPNFMYSVVCEATRHILIYQKVSNENSQLRKRTQGVAKLIKVGHQHVINIDKYGEVLGIEATNEYLFVLSENTLLVIKI